MQLYQVTIVLALAVGLCLARTRSLTRSAMDINIDEVKKMILEYDPVVKEHLKQAEQSASSSIAARMFQHGIRQFQSAVDAGEPIPAVAAKLGLSTLVKLVVSAGLKPVLEGKGPFTLFGPTNDAFTNLPDWAKKEVNDTKVLTEILTYHVIPGVVKSTDLNNNLVAKSVEGKPIRINMYNPSGSNAPVYTAQCAPIDLTNVDKTASNGIVHVLKSVMIPPSGNIVATLAACPDFKTLVEAVKVGGLVDTLTGPGPFTVFAPTEKAFGKLPPGTIKKLIKNPKELAKILTYHVVSGTFCSAGLSSGEVKTVEGDSVKVDVSAGGVKVNNANVVYADGSVTNGVVHAIDTVLLPPNFELP